MTRQDAVVMVRKLATNETIAVTFAMTKAEAYKIPQSAVPGLPGSVWAWFI